jgi:hypothetical protein
MHVVIQLLLFPTSCAWLPGLAWLPAPPRPVPQTDSTALAPPSGVMASAVAALTGEHGQLLGSCRSFQSHCGHGCCDTQLTALLRALLRLL